MMSWLVILQLAVIISFIVFVAIGAIIEQL